MKRSLYLIPALCLLFASCDLADDKFKTYAEDEDVFPVKFVYVEYLENGVSEDEIQLNTEIENFVPGSAYTFEPVFEEGFEPEPGRYKYTWFVQYQVTSGRSERIDIIKDADTPAFNGVIPSKVSPDIRTPTLYVEILDEALGLRRLGKKYLPITSSGVGGRGIYILKDMGGKTDVDYFKLRALKDIGGDGPFTLPSQQQLQNEVMADVIKMGMGQPLEGTPTCFSMMEASYWWYNPVDEVNQSRGAVWYIGTETDLVTMTGNFGEVLNHFDQHFYAFSKPATIAPEALSLRVNSYGINPYTSGTSTWIVNDGQLWRIAPPVGFTNPVKADTWVIPADGIIPSVNHHCLFSHNGSLFWDNSRGQLCYLTGSIITVFTPTAYATAEGDDLLGGKKVDVVAMLPGGGEVRVITGNAGDVNSHIILKNKANSDHYLMKWVASRAAAGDRWIHNIPAGADIISTPHSQMASSFYNEVVYYVKGNQIWLYEDQNQPFGTTTALGSYQRDTGMRIGDGETVVKLRTIGFDSNYNDSFPAHGYFGLTVLTSTPGGGYKYYIFISPNMRDEFNAQADFILTGEGTPVDDRARFDYMFG